MNNKDDRMNSKEKPQKKNAQKNAAGDAGVADICVLACAEAFRGDGEIFCNPIGTIPVLGGRLARAFFEPSLVLTDTVSLAVQGDMPVGKPLNISPGSPNSSSGLTIESYTPYRTIFDIVWAGRRHVMMGASQIDMWGNQNIAAIGDYKKPKAQLLGLRGAPGNLVNHTASYFVPNHSLKSFVEKVDIVSGPGYNQDEIQGAARENLEIRRVVSNLGVFDFENPEKRIQIRSLHPGVSLEQVRAETGFELLATDYSETPAPSPAQLDFLNEVLDPNGLRHKETG